MLSFDVNIKLCAEFKFSTMAGTGHKVCGGWVDVFKHILVFSLAEAEQYKIFPQNLLFRVSTQAH